jgi:hypothetical protein
LLEGENCDSTGSDKGAVESTKFLLVTSGKEAHVMQIGSIGSDNKTNIKDLTYGKTYEDKLLELTGSTATISLGSLGNIKLNIVESSGYIFINDSNLAPGDKIETKYGANLTLVGTTGFTTASTGIVSGVPSAKNGTILISEEAKYNADEPGTQWNLSMYYYVTDDELRLSTPIMNVTTGYEGAPWTAKDLSASRADRDTKFYVSEWGTMLTYDSENKDDITIAYPDEQVYANVFIAPVGATVSGAGEGSAVTLNAMHVGSAKLASEIAGQEKTQNLILVGGPCANEAVKIIMGATDDCTAGFEAGKAMVKLYENGGNVAMVFAGFNAADTRRATTVVAAYADYAGKLTGTEVVVSGTSMSDITVSAPSQ